MAYKGYGKGEQDKVIMTGAVVSGFLAPFSYCTLQSLPNDYTTGTEGGEFQW